MATYAGTSLKYVQKVYVENLDKFTDSITYNVPSDHYLLISAWKFYLSYYNPTGIPITYSIELSINGVTAFYDSVAPTAIVNGLYEKYQALPGGLYCPGPTTVTLYNYFSGAVGASFNSRYHKLVGALFTNG
jgi:hypothetical protein